MRADRTNRLSPITLTLHWLIALAIIANLSIGYIVEDMDEDRARASIVGVHQSIGLTILLLALARAWWRMRNGFPAPLGRPPRWQSLAARAVHVALIVAAIAMPLSGVFLSLSFGGTITLWGWELISATGEASEAQQDLAAMLHASIGNLIGAVVLVHIAAALKHHFVDRDGTLRRMLGRDVGA